MRWVRGGAALLIATNLVMLPWWNWPQTRSAQLAVPAWVLVLLIALAFAEALHGFMRPGSRWSRATAGGMTEVSMMMAVFGGSRLNASDQRFLFWAFLVLSAVFHGLAGWSMSVKQQSSTEGL